MAAHDGHELGERHCIQGWGMGCIEDGYWHRGRELRGQRRVTCIHHDKGDWAKTNELSEQVKQDLHVARFAHGGSDQQRLGCLQQLQHME